MAVFLFVIAVLVGGFGGLILMNAQSAIHEIEAFVLFLTAAVLVSGACIVDTVKTGFAKMRNN